MTSAVVRVLLSHVINVHSAPCGRQPSYQANSLGQRGCYRRHLLLLHTDGSTDQLLWSIGLIGCRSQSYHRDTIMIYGDGNRGQSTSCHLCSKSKARNVSCLWYQHCVWCTQCPQKLHVLNCHL